MKDKTNLKIAIPTVNGQLCQHFGHCETFALLEVDQENREILNSQGLTPPAHEPGVLPEWLHSQGADVIIAGGMGQMAQQMFARNGIKVVVGASENTPETIVAAYLEGTLNTGINACDH